MRPPLPFPAQRQPRPLKLKRPAKDSPRCENLLNRRLYVEHRMGGAGSYQKLPPTQCTHRGYRYKLNGLLTMTLCICCLHRLRKHSNLSARTVRPAPKVKADAHDSKPPVQRSGLL